MFRPLAEVTNKATTATHGHPRSPGREVPLGERLFGDRTLALVHTTSKNSVGVCRPVYHKRMKLTPSLSEIIPGRRVWGAKGG